MCRLVRVRSLVSACRVRSCVNGDVERGRADRSTRRQAGQAGGRRTSALSDGAARASDSPEPGEDATAAAAARAGVRGREPWQGHAVAPDA